MTRVFARTATIDHENHRLTIDGIELPYHVEIDPEVENDDGMINILRLGIFVDGPVSVIPKGGQAQVVDLELGPVGDWARAFVRQGLLEAFPDLKLEA